jgi:hypothetical protein
VEVVEIRGSGTESGCHEADASVAGARAGMCVGGWFRGQPLHRASRLAPTAAAGPAAGRVTGAAASNGGGRGVNRVFPTALAAGRGLPAGGAEETARGGLSFFAKRTQIAPRGQGFKFACTSSDGPRGRLRTRNLAPSDF